MIETQEFILAFFASVALAGLVTPIMRKMAIKFAVFDHPTESHKTHKTLVPYLGGLAIILSVSVTSLIGLSYLGFDSATWVLLVSVLVPAFILGLIGLVDDLKKLSPISRFLAQTISGVFTASILISTNTVGSPTGIMVIDFMVTVFWIVGITNSVNFFDNHDGGASGTVAISSMGLFILATIGNQYFIAALALVLSGACIGFLFWNRSPARIYMGDAGALFLGTMLASLLVRYEPNPINRIASFSIPIFLLAIPILDTCVAVFSRIRRRKSPFQGGKDHLSHRLVRLEFSRKGTALILWALSALFVAAAILISHLPTALEGVAVGIGSIIWLTLFVFFMRQKDG